jgi:hypothetical protein
MLNTAQKETFHDLASVEINLNSQSSYVDKQDTAHSLTSVQDLKNSRQSVYDYEEPQGVRQNPKKPQKSNHNPQVSDNSNRQNAIASALKKLKQLKYNENIKKVKHKNKFSTQYEEDEDYYGSWESEEKEPGISYQEIAICIVAGIIVMVPLVFSFSSSQFCTVW